MAKIMPKCPSRLAKYSRAISRGSRTFDPGSRLIFSVLKRRRKRVRITCVEKSTSNYMDL